MDQRLWRTTWRDVVVILTATVASLLLAQQFLPAFLLPSVAVGIGVGWVLRLFLDRERWQALELLVWVGEGQERAKRSGDRPDPPSDVPVASKAHAEAYQRFRDTGQVDVAAWRSAAEAVAEPSWRTPHLALIAVVEAVAAFEHGDPRWRELLAEGRRRIVPFRLPSRARLRLLAARLYPLLFAVVGAIVLYLIFSVDPELGAFGI